MVISCDQGDFVRGQKGHLENVCEFDGIILNLGAWKRTYDEILEHRLAVPEVNGGTSCGLHGLLDEDRIGAETRIQCIGWVGKDEYSWVRKSVESSRELRS